jgi:predicted DNA-binding transcriptional regulator AlpA
MAAAKDKLLTLSDVSRRTGISMPTLLRYKKLYEGRIPAQGEGRKQRFPVSAVAVFVELKRERMASRKTGGPPLPRPTAGRALPSRPMSMGPATPEGMLSLNEIGRITGISYPTLVRYVKLYLASLPHSGQGRKRRFFPDAVAVFRRLRSESRRGRKPGGGGVTGAAGMGAEAGRLGQRLAELERAQKHLARQIERVLEEIRKPFNIQVRR